MRLLQLYLVYLLFSISLCVCRCPCEGLSLLCQLVLCWGIWPCGHHPICVNEIAAAPLSLPGIDISLTLFLSPSFSLSLSLSLSLSFSLSLFLLFFSSLSPPILLFSFSMLSWEFLYCMFHVFRVNCNDVYNVEYLDWFYKFYRWYWYFPNFLPILFLLSFSLSLPLSSPFLFSPSLFLYLTLFSYYALLGISLLYLTCTFSIL